MIEKELKLKTSLSTLIEFGNGFALGKHLENKIQGRKAAVITDTNVEALYAEKIEHLDLKIFSFPAGEKEKSRETKAMLEDLLLSHNFGKDTLIIGLGGGVVTDIAGFLASTYCRGVDLILIPTTLLGMVDAAIGGKNGVNTPHGKNTIGTIYPPEAILIDTEFLKTLPQKEKANGIVEMLKSGLIASEGLFNELKNHASNWETFALDFIYQTVVIKRDIVQEKSEEGIRHALNLGHTFGHAIEMLENYEIDHGRAVAIGILVSCYIAKKINILETGTMNQISEVYNLYKIDVKLPQKYPLKDFINALSKDKKAIKGRPRFVLLKSIGKAAPFDGEYCTELDFDILEEAIDWMHTNFCEEPSGNIYTT